MAREDPDPTVEAGSEAATNPVSLRAAVLGRLRPVGARLLDPGPAHDPLGPALWAPPRALHV